MTRPTRILFFADAGPAIGGGHVMRCLTLARALMARGAVCAFVAPPAARALMEVFAPPGIEAIEVADDGPVGMVAQTRLAAERYAPDWLVVDHYRLDCRDENTLRAVAPRLMVIDDLAERRRDCDLLLDPSHGRTPDDYLGLVPEDAEVLAGAPYALVGPEFAARREAALARRYGPVRGVLVSLGLTDLGGVTGRTVQALLPVLGELTVDVALGAGASSLERLRNLDDPRIALHVDAADMARLTAEADLAIGAGGSSVWERACLGLPAVTLILADNQRALAKRMDAEGLTVAVEAGAAEDALRAAFARLAGDGDLRLTMSERLAALCDGLGAERVAAVILNPSPSRGKEG